MMEQKAGKVMSKTQRRNEEGYGNYRIDIIAAENVSDHVVGTVLSEEKPDFRRGEKESYRSGDIPDFTLQYCEVFYDRV